MPNIIFFLTDDHGIWAAGCYGNREIQTPTLDRLAAGGVRFDNAFTPVPVCSPGRACLLTGQTASQVGIHDWLEEGVPEIANRDWLDGAKTLFEYLHEAGYYTGLCGKWHLGRSHLPPRGADYHFGIPYWQGRHNETFTYVENGQELELTGNKSGFVTDHAIKFLDQAPADRPFFLNVGYIATHSPYDQQSHDPAVTALYQDATFDDIPPYDEPHPWQKNEGLAGGENVTEQDIIDRYIGYYAAVTEIDRNVTRIIEKLEAMGRLEDTIIVYTSDHGCAIGHHGFWGKGNSTRPLNMYDVSLRVPLIWSGPGAQAGEVVAHCVDHYDTFMTLLDRLDLTPDVDRRFPGLSYGPMLEGRAMPWDETRFGEYGDLRMVRTPAWKLVWRYPNGPHDLFNLANDPGETQNVIDDPANRTIYAELKRKIDGFYAEYTDPEKSGLRVKELPKHNSGAEAWRDDRRETRGLQEY